MSNQAGLLRPGRRFEFVCELVVAAVGLDLYSYHAQELFVSLAFFTVTFLFLALIVVGAVLVWRASEQLAGKSGPWSRKLIAFSRRLIAASERT